MKSSQTIKPEAQRFVEEMLRIIRREFFGSATDKQFFQERPILIKAITWPARWLKDKGVTQPMSKYRQILLAVIATIKRHGRQVKFRRFSLYFFKAVQEHMNHHGEEYYYQAKVRPVGEILPGLTRDVRPGRVPDRATEILSQINRVVRSPGGRRRAIQKADSGDLFSHCKGPAAAAQKDEKYSQTFAVSGDSAP